MSPLHSILYNLTFNRLLKQHIKQLVQQTATHIMHSGGVVRGLNSMGTLTLPERMKKKGQRNVYHKTGKYVFAFPLWAF